MAAKRTRVTDAEKEQMWLLYQKGYTFVAIGKKLHRGADMFMHMKPQ